MLKVFRFNYSPYCLKVEKLFDLIKLPYERVPVPYLNRESLAAMTNGYIMVPVVQDERGKVITESKDICEHFVKLHPEKKMVPEGLEAVTWAFHDWCDNQFEDVMFRISSPFVAKKFIKADERAFYHFIKERKFGKNCVQSWEREAALLTEKARTLVRPAEETLRRQPYLLGETPTLADAAFYGQFAMLEEAGLNPESIFGATIGAWYQKLSR